MNNDFPFSLKILGYFDAIRGLLSFVMMIIFSSWLFFLLSSSDGFGFLAILVTIGASIIFFTPTSILGIISFKYTRKNNQKLIKTTLISTLINLILTPFYLFLISDPLVLSLSKSFTFEVSLLSIYLNLVLINIIFLIKAKLKNQAKFKLISILIIITFVFLATIFFFRELNIIEKNSRSYQREVTRKYKTEKANWNNFYDNRVRLSLKYPELIEMNKLNENGISLFVEIEPIENLNSMAREIADKDKNDLARGLSGQGLFNKIIKIKNIGKANAQESMFISLLKDCNAQINRKLVFYENNYRIIITLSTNINDADDENNKYFEMNKNKCDGINIWKDQGAEKLYKDLNENKLHGKIQNWFNLFDKIIETMQFSN